MRTRHEYIDILRLHAKELQTRFGISYMRLFGSVATEKNHEGSDIDLYVVMPPKAYDIVSAADYLKELLGCDVDLICKHKGIRPFFLNQIEKYGITVFGAA